ncbi:hypothetical protein P7I46_16395, partial [Enterococcus casseliflavus]|uniref:hypothetical protein n=1 Tax=Enterococcus casseliflavus TaxID=37734 RepID=UPI002890BEFF
MLKIVIIGRLKLPLANTHSFFNLLYNATPPREWLFFCKKIAQHILIRRAGGTMFRHHNNHHIIIY